MLWEVEFAAWKAALQAGADVGSPDEAWQTFTEALAAPPAVMDRDELALRRVLGVA